MGSLLLALRLLCLMQTSGSTENEMDGIHFTLLYHVSNLAGKLQASNTECLLPAFSYLYCCLCLSLPLTALTELCPCCCVTPG
ncbi:meiosis inhibitor protein 1-like [Oncorhynchus tshawytscha]|uniref:meiosis inhibitor protein 1-like n=1 Tax=Oncorhynchus tshawytscha TaxID=74940 RepID=UPI000D09C2EC|nr:meiosis inhibitor protein 1-like [Oncorhynchus tshawytscha]XP_042183488.1 meiosis inhibitor protein 1-like [Oncorhynchus tshawytscha]XP_042183489.1 meiosis inhibitor protein 1-like [Oncorhynchus tshawytscha]